MLHEGWRLAMAAAASWRHCVLRSIASFCRADTARFVVLTVGMLQLLIFNPTLTLYQPKSAG